MAVRRVGIGSWVALCSALVALPACLDPQPRPANVILIVLDTVRADHLSSYGYPLKTTPNLDALAATSDRYTRARATAPWTTPSHASILTGLEVFEHGAQARLADGEIREFPLAEEHLTLAEALRSEGYRTGAVVANWIYLGARHGFGQGFDVYYEETARHANVAGAPDVTQRALGWLDAGLSKGGSNEDEPFFLFLNYMEAHRPYHVVPLPDERAAELPRPARANPQKLLDALVHVVLETERRPPPRLIRQVISQYDNGVAHADLAVGELIAGLRARGLFDDTLLIVTSDHGEYFAEHDLVEHSKDVYEEALAVPLIVKRPGQLDGRIIDAPFSLTGLPALVVRQLGAPASAELARAFPRDGSEPNYAELRYTRRRDLFRPYGARFKRVRTVVYRSPYKAIWSSDGEHELYDLTRDPREQSNLVDSRRDAALPLFDLVEQAHERSRAAGHAGEAMEFTPDELENLRELGYIE